MRNHFTYSILQYRHSLALGEALNVGVLFYFPSEEKMEFVYGNGARLKAVYPDFDASLLGAYLKTITNKLTNRYDNLEGDHLKDGLKSFLHLNILGEDDSALQFAAPASVINTFSSPGEAIKAYSKLLLPGIETSKPEVVRHNETFILRQYTGYIFDKYKNLETKFRKNEVVETNGVSLKFELAWQNGTHNLVKPVSFDLIDEQSIQHKSAQYLGYLTFLNEYALKKHCRFDLLIAAPQKKDRGLRAAYDKALEVLHSAQAPKRIVTEDRLQAYSEETIEELLSH